MYHLYRAEYPKTTIAVVGCGGTGGFVAEGLCRMLAPGVQIILIDHDGVEERNLLRQNFYREDIGRFKSQALAERLAKLYGRAVGWSVLPYGMDPKGEFSRNAANFSLTIGCVDNAQARQAIAAQVRSNQWWIDAGNGENWGQVLIGNSRGRDLFRAFNPADQTCHRLPLPTIQHPELLSPPPTEEVRPLSCAELLDTGDQDPTINQTMASLILQVVKRILMGDCPWMGLYLDLGMGTLNSVMCTPENVSRIARVRQSSLVRR